MALRPVYSTQFICGDGMSEYDYTCPEGYVALVSCIDITTDTSVTGDGSVYAGLEQVAGATALFWSATYEGGYFYVKWRGKIILSPGDVLGVIAFGDNFSCSVSGDLLSLP